MRGNGGELSARKLQEPCLSCKLITVGCLFTIGGYLFYLGRAQQKNSKHLFNGLATASIALGVGEIFDKSPFRSDSE